MQNQSDRESRTVAVLAGDGVGPEVVEEAIPVLDAACAAASLSVRYEHRLVGGAAIETEGAPISDATMEICRNADAVLLGAVGGPQWIDRQGTDRPQYGLHRLRRELATFANIRPIRVHPGLIARTPFRDEVVRGTDLVIVRELNGGAYYGPHDRSGAGPTEQAVDTTIYTRSEIERVGRVAFELALSRRRRLISVDKMGVMWSGTLWREVITELAADYSDVTLEHQLVDSFAARLIESPRDFDVVLTENLFGDILSDEAAVLMGSLGMLASASLGAGNPGLYEPAHGSAPTLTGTNRVNPLATILSVAMMLEHSLGAPDVAVQVRTAVDDVVSAGVLTPDLGGTATTREVGQAVVDALNGPAAPAQRGVHAGAGAA